MQQRNTKKYRLRKGPVQKGVGQSGGLQNKIQNTNTKYKIQNAKCKMQNVFALNSTIW